MDRTKEQLKDGRYMVVEVEPEGIPTLYDNHRSACDEAEQLVQQYPHRQYLVLWVDSLVEEKKPPVGVEVQFISDF